MIRLKDIAQAGGVSVMTVSKVMRDAPDISAATKSRIRDLAEKMGYVPDASARGLRNRQTKLLGLIISAATNPIYARVTMALEAHAYQAGYDVLLAHSLNDPKREATCIRRLLARRVDGIFISPVYRLQDSAPIYQEIQRHHTPCVILGHRASFCENFANVETDSLKAAMTATQHLIQLGHRRIAYLSGPLAAPWAKDRLEGYRLALREARIPWDDHLIFQAGGTIEEGNHAAEQMLHEGTKATAIQAVNDLVAIGAAGHMIRQGVRIPEELSIIGFGNILTSEHFQVPLTTMRQPKLRQGEAAMGLMESLMKGGSPRSIVIEAKLIVRASTASLDTLPLPSETSLG
ncbi:LacI family transcriptional regulator [Verrucomicrobia bacterium]|nr:LacI family transcriptional regulator [Verrucomicrobiota bacterium]